VLESVRASGAGAAMVLCWALLPMVCSLLSWLEKWSTEGSLLMWVLGSILEDPGIQKWPS